jgi:guanylate cyclase
MAKAAFLRQMISNIVLTIARIGANPDDSDEVRLQKAIQVNAVILGGIPTQAGIGILLVAFKEYVGAGLVLGFASLSLIGVIVLGWTRSHYAFFKFTQLAIAIVSPFLGTLVMGGIANIGFSLMWGLVAPLLALVLYKPRQAVYWFIAFLAAVFISGVAQPYLRPANNIPASVLAVITINNVIGISVMVFGALYFFVSQRDLAFRLLNVEREKAENLLLNILPKEIATILKDRNDVIADHIGGASILFADVVDFTPMSARMTPVELVELLNEVFSYFDTLAEKYGLEKIKTIGDCYMVASGVPRPRSDHAHALTRMALEMREYVRSHDFRGRTLKFRIGINSGPVVAGVIGRKKFMYDLWGDAVNTASRMESHGQGDVIQIARATYELIKKDFVCEPRGAIHVKGKGEMEVWHVVG